MRLQLVSLPTLRKWIQENAARPELYAVTVRPPHGVQVTRDAQGGWEALTQSLATRCGMTEARLESLDRRLGWLLVYRC